MTLQYDAIIVGSGPAGISVAFPLVKSGMRVLMVDGGKCKRIEPPVESFLDYRIKQSNQWKWMIGDDFSALRNMSTNSPKLRIPIHQYVFEDFNKENHIVTKNFESIGSLSTGGLSNAWGCGIAAESEEEMLKFPCDPLDLIRSYQTVARRIGISGRVRDDMSDYFGVDAWSQAPIKADALHEYLIGNYEAHPDKANRHGLRIGRARIAVLSEDHMGRQACKLSGNCLWGCHQRSLYSSIDELPMLTAYSNFKIIKGLIVDRIDPEGGGWSISGRRQNNNEKQIEHGKILILAAGTLASTRIVLTALNSKERVRLLFTPTAAFLLWLPRLMGQKRISAFGYAQSAYRIKINKCDNAFGWLFSTNGIPVSEFTRYLPLKRPLRVEVLRSILSSCIVGNIFFPGSMSAAEAWVNEAQELCITGGFSDSFPEVLSKVRKKIMKGFRSLNAVMIPGSFQTAKPGSDIHYTGTLPMQENPRICQTKGTGEVYGTEGLYVVDGACLPSSSEKAHTLTIMANADRVGKLIAQKFKPN